MAAAEPWKPDSVSHLWECMDIFLAGTGKSRQGQTRDGDGDNCPRAWMLNWEPRLRRKLHRFWQKLCPWKHFWSKDLDIYETLTMSWALSLSNSYSKPTSWVYILFIFLDEEMEPWKLSDLPKFTKLVSGRSGLRTQVCLKSHTLNSFIVIVTFQKEEIFQVSLKRGTWAMWLQGTDLKSRLS